MYLKKEFQIIEDTHLHNISVTINAYDMDSIKILSVQSPSELGEGYGHLDAFSKPHNVYECEYSYRQVPELSRLLEDIVINYNTDKDMTDVINEIKDYENSENMEKNTRLYELYIEALSLFKGVLVRETINYDDTEKEQAKRLFK